MYNRKTESQLNTIGTVSPALPMMPSELYDMHQKIETITAFSCTFFWRGAQATRPGLAARRAVRSRQADHWPTTSPEQVVAVSRMKQPPQPADRTKPQQELLLARSRSNSCALAD